MREFHSTAALIEQHRGNGVEFGEPEGAPSDQWIRKAEQRLGMPFPPSYLWFLRNYGGGEITGDEVFSIYQMEFEEVFGGDIVFKYLAHIKDGTIAASEIPVCETDFGEVFILDASVRDESGEYPVYRLFGKNRELYAANFAEFLERKIRNK
ncbi:SMI1/KNR4 family protein [Verrucomicrobium sp. BvORR034]|uniref:SMI1/KNR4 family protein n=1 Tax=Verrucomicrobium sp. BvORR034 TaxID=1396418 RepID=UPI00067992EC|nr:SMI1/KNR4 family protein [Verrucomicrobium sp. BvORR034]